MTVRNAVVTPILNPLIYSLRNDKVTETLRVAMIPTDVAHGILSKARRTVLDQLFAGKYLQSFLAEGLGGNLGSGATEDNSLPLSKRHSDGIFTNSYSRYRKQMAVKKYLAAVLGKRYKQRVKNKGRRTASL
ncbi:pituitary adenylate cyclase-activating polypeptide-like [Tamandua tetradactyla]|uniref:pituitary adenylate cyclase-activating polypeptide-like n=1 Tax=Tamandua tetradactyla TaxID=48850 RepID=UPI00405464FE